MSVHLSMAARAARCAWLLSIIWVCAACNDDGSSEDTEPRSDIGTTDATRDGGPDSGVGRVDAASLPADATPPVDVQSNAPDADDPCDPQPDSDLPHTADAGLQIPRSRPGHDGCRSDIFFVDIPIWSSPGTPALPFDLKGLLLGPDGRGVPTDWFCPPDAPPAPLSDGGADAEVPSDAGLMPRGRDVGAPGDSPCELDIAARRAAGGGVVHVESVLNRSPDPNAVVDDDAWRFFRIVLPRPVRDERLGTVVAAIRSAAGRILPDPPYVGRECVAVPLSVEPWATPQMRTWHLLRSGVDPNAEPPAHPPMSMDVALIDTGIDSAVATAIGVHNPEVEIVPIDGPWVGPIHPHGTAMSLFIRQMAPNAAVYSYRALDGNGVGLIGDVARAVESAIASRHNPEDPKALVVNFSVGWPPELGRPRRIAGTAEHEDPVGESVRYMLHRARQLTQRDNPIVVIAAAGNRPGRRAINQRIYDAWFDLTGAGAPTGCGIDVIPTRFFPAAWSRVPTCVDPDDRQFLAWAVDAVNGFDRPSAMSVDGATTAVVAPGEHAYVGSDAPGLPATPAVSACGPSDEPALDGGFTTPRAYTGTSVAAALVSGAVARVLGRLAAQGVHGYSAATLRYLLYLTGEAVPGQTNDGDNVRRLSACRAEAAASCSATVMCLFDADDQPMLNPELLHLCQLHVGSCEAQPECPQIAQDWVAWPSEYRPGPNQVCQCNDVHAVRWQMAEQCQQADGACPFEKGIDTHSLGTVGSLPYSPPCPDCGWLFVRSLDGGPEHVDIRLSLNPDRRRRDPIRSAWLMFRELGANGDTVSTRYVSLKSLSTVETWKFGDDILLRDMPSPISLAGNLKPGSVEVELYIYSQSKPDHPVAKEVVPLRVVQE